MSLCCDVPWMLSNVLTIITHPHFHGYEIESLHASFIHFQNLSIANDASLILVDWYAACAGTSCC